MEIKNTPTLYLVSASLSRQKILSELRIPFSLIPHDADEAIYDSIPILEDRVRAVALLKMQRAHFSRVSNQCNELFALSADTLTLGPDGVIYGKPRDRAHARAMLSAKAHGPSRTVTFLCVEKKRFVSGVWTTVKQAIASAEGETVCHVPPDWVDWYLDASGAMGASGALAIEGIGQLFVKAVYGSYTAIRGLPALELRQALEEVGFFDEHECA